MPRPDDIVLGGFSGKDEEFVVLQKESGETGEIIEVISMNRETARKIFTDMLAELNED